MAETLTAATQALAGTNCWNMAGGYHHASPQNAEGFCIYNDITITHHELVSKGLLPASDKILIVDIDAHQGNGNAYYFMENSNVTPLDIYNDDIYPRMPSPKARVDIGVPLHSGANGAHYLNALHNGLNQIKGTYRLAFVIAGTDVLAVDPLGGLDLTMDDCVARDKVLLEKLRNLSIPFVVLGGGGYSKDSAKVISKSIAALYQEK